jgi:hypothetical protein
VVGAGVGELGEPVGLAESVGAGEADGLAARLDGAEPLGRIGDKARGALEGDGTGADDRGSEERDGADQSTPASAVRARACLRAALCFESSVDITTSRSPDARFQV